MQQARAIAEAAARAKAEAEARAEAERRARAEAEDRAKAEAVARVMQEHELRAKAEEEIKARVAAELKARELAEIEADARYRKEAAERARAAAAERKQREEEERAAAAAQLVRRKTNWPKLVGIAAGVVLVAALVLLHVAPLPFLVAPAEEALAQRLGVPAKVFNVRYALLPSPRLTLERVSIGKLEDIKIESIVVDAGPLALLAVPVEIEHAEAVAVRVPEDALALVPAWTRAAPGAPGFSVRRLKLRSVKVGLRALDLAAFDVEAAFAHDGRLERAVLSDGRLRVALAPKNGSLAVQLDARNWQAPLGPALVFDELRAAGVLGPKEARFTAIEGRLGPGTVKATARASWASGIRVEGDFSLAGCDLAQLLGVFTRDFTASGTLNANGAYQLEAGKLDELFAAPRVEASFTVERGVLNNVDIVRAVQSPSREGLRGGRTQFNDLAGTLQLANNTYSYRDLRLASGPMSASGSVEIAPNGELSGRISAQVGSKSLVVARGTLTVGGNLKTPTLRP
jgi:hypothetical protein